MNELLPQRLLRALIDHPSLWPAGLLVVGIPFTWIVARHRPSAAFFVRRRVRLLAALGILGVSLFSFTGLTYLHCAAFYDAFESREASVAALLRRGGVIYPGSETLERYCAPYGPALYLIMGTSQAVFGASVWATKLPSVLAALAALALFWNIVRRQYASRTAAWAITGIEAGLLMAFRHLPFWAKADSMTLCAATAGLFAAFRRGWGWCLALGASTGLAVDLKPHALAYFLPSLVVAFQTGWRRREYTIWAVVTVVTAALPYVAMPTQFPLANHIAYLVITAREGCGAREILGFCRWIGLLTAFVYLFDRLTFHPRDLTEEERTLRRAYHLSLALGVALVTVPACSVGAGHPHLIPLIPLFLLAAGDRFSNRLRVRWRAAPHFFWVSAAVSTVLACLLIALQSTVRMTNFHLAADAPAKACAEDAQRLLAKYGQRTVLNGSGGQDMLTIYERHNAVFAGHPIGIDPAAIMDYQRGGVEEPDLGRFIAEMRAHYGRELVWLLPRGAAPFAGINIYDERYEVYSPAFRRDFLTRFERREQTRFYDVYLPKNETL